MRELVGGKNTVGRMAAVLKKPHKATFTFTFFPWVLIVYPEDGPVGPKHVGQ